MVCIYTVENFPIPLTVYYQAMQKQEKGFVVLLENTTCYFLSWRENRSKTLCILELIKKKILTAHDLNVVHRTFFTCNHFLFSKKDVTCTKYRFPQLKCQLKQNKNFERFEPSESLYFINWWNVII